jgi:uncharacterized protein YecT (DUF1311 family)
MKTFAKLLIAAGIAVLPAAPALAANACNNPGSDFDQVYCYTKLFMVADADLNAAYKKLAAKLNKGSRAALKSSEVAWIKSRNQSCAENRGNEIVVNLNCTVDQTAARTNWLAERSRECSASSCKSEKFE